MLQWSFAATQPSLWSQAIAAPIPYPPGWLWSNNVKKAAVRSAAPNGEAPSASTATISSSSPFFTCSSKALVLSTSTLTR